MLFLCHDVSGKQHQNLTMDMLTIKLRLLLFLLSVLMSSSVYAEKLFFFDIPTQSADQGLINFAKSTNKTVIFSYELTQKFTNNPLNGYYSFEH